MAVVFLKLQYFSRRDALAIRIPILTVIILMLVAFLVSFYYFHDWIWGMFYT